MKYANFGPKLEIILFLTVMKYKLNMPKYVDQNINKLFKYVFLHEDIVMHNLSGRLDS